MVAMVVTNTIKYGSKIASKEGMENNEEEDEEEIIRENQLVQTETKTREKRRRKKKFQQNQEPRGVSFSKYRGIDRI